MHSPSRARCTIELTLPSIRTRTWLLKMPISLRTVTEVPASGTSAVEMYFCHRCMIMSAWRMTSKGERSGSVLPSSRVSWCRALHGECIDAGSAGCS